MGQKKKAKIKRNTIIANYSKGGLRMPDVFAIHIASQIQWIKNYLMIHCQTPNGRH